MNFLIGLIGNEVAEELRKVSHDLVALIVPSSVFTYIKDTKVLQELDRLIMAVSFDWKMFLPAGKELKIFLLVDNSTYTLSGIFSGKTNMHPKHSFFMYRRYFRPIFTQFDTFF